MSDSFTQRTSDDVDYTQLEEFHEFCWGCTDIFKENLWRKRTLLTIILHALLTINYKNLAVLTLSWRKSQPYRKYSIYLQSK